MKQLSEVTEQSQHATLVRAVIRRIGLDSVEDVVNHGIDGGFSGFIYYADTVKFFKSYRQEILALAKDTADQLGEDMLSMIAGFNCLKGEKFNNDDIARAIYQDKDSEIAPVIQNALAWFAAEEVCRMFEE